MFALWRPLHTMDIDFSILARGELVAFIINVDALGLQAILGAELRSSSSSKESQ
jgi:hypothetical protein